MASRAEGSRLRFGAAVAEHRDLTEALEPLLEAVSRQLGDARPDFATLFISAPHLAARRQELARFQAELAEALGTEALVGCSASGVIAGGTEVEQGAAAALFAGALPAARVACFSLSEVERREIEEPAALRDRLGLDAKGAGPILIFMDPYTFHAEDFLDQLAEACPRVPVLGGIASGANAPGLNTLFQGRAIENNGCVGVQLDGDFDFAAIVSQGCKPIGRHAVITRGKGRVIEQIRGRRSREFLKEVLDALPDEDLKLVRNSLLLGRVTREAKDRFERGDFLIRPILRLDDCGLLVGDEVKVGQTVCFHVRDARTAREDLLELIDRHRGGLAERACGAVLFTCTGRGERLFGEPHHDARLLRAELGEIPIGGFFCGGEIGPIGARPFLHGFTSSVGIFAERGA